MTNSSKKMAGIVLAAGMSLRMGEPKMALPWKGSTVLGTVLDTLYAAGLIEITVVTGGGRDVVEDTIDRMSFLVSRCFNPNFANGEMLESIKVGLSTLGSEVDSAMIVLGDQPQIESEVVSELIARYKRTRSPLIVPSYQNRRGHPWLISRKYWDEILGMATGQTMRNFFVRHAGEIEYLVVDTPSVLQDLDTPEDYRKSVEGKSRGKKK